MNLAPLVRSVILGAWRAEPPPLSLTAEELAAVTPLLRQTHAENLAWWRVRGTPLAETEWGRALADTYRMSVLRNALQARVMVDAVERLREQGIESLVVKGWAVARHYPAPGLRPYGDVDLYVPEGQLEHAQVVAKGLPRDIDVQSTTLYEVYAREFETLAERAERYEVEGSVIRVLGPEDHLRLLCLHLLDHGAWRPLWLCDIAAAMEQRRPGFEWERVLYGSPRVADWVLCALCLAHVLLDVSIADTPAEARVQTLPRWLVPTVLRHWELGNAFSTRHHFGVLLRRHWRQPPRLVEALRLRWPDPIRASMFCRAPFDGSSRLPYQFRTALASAPAIAGQFRSALLESPAADAGQTGRADLEREPGSGAQ